MYNLNDYLRSGFTYVNNSIRPGHKRLDTLMIYATTRCQSACKHCNIWKKPQEHLTLADIKRLMTAKMTEMWMRPEKIPTLVPKRTA